MRWSRLCGGMAVALAQVACGELLGVDTWQTAPASTASLGGGGSGAGTAGGGAGGAPAECVAWGALYGGRDSDSARGVAVDPVSGDIVVAGEFQGELSLGDTSVTSKGRDVFLARFRSDGQPLWVEAFGDGNVQVASGVASAADGSIVVSGTFIGDIAFGGNLLHATGQDVFVASVGASGATSGWALGIGDDAFQLGAAVDIDRRSGEVVVAGNYEGDGDFGLGPLQAAMSPARSMFVARLDKETVVSATGATGAGNHVTAVAVGPDGSVVAVGTFDTTFAIDALMEDGSADLWMAKLDVSGSVVWLKSFVGTDMLEEEALDVVVDDTGEIGVVGRFSGTMTVPGVEVLVADNTFDGFIARLASDGTPLWGERIGGRGPLDETNAVAIGADGRMYVTGRVDGVLDVGGGDDLPGEHPDAYVAVFEPDGTYTWGARLNDDADFDQRGLAIAPHPCGIVVVGEMAGTADFGAGPVSAKPGGTDFFVALVPLPR